MTEVRFLSQGNNLTIIVFSLWFLIIFWFLFFKLKYSWHIILCLFQVYYIVIWHLHTLWNDHHDKSNYHLSPYEVIYIIIDHIPYTSLWVIYFLTRRLYFLIPFTYFAQPHSPPLWQSPLCSLYVRVCFHCLFLFFRFHV